MFKLSPNRITFFICWFFVSLVLISSSYAKPPAPVIFIHGLGGDGTTWKELGKTLDQSGWDPGTCNRVIDIISSSIITPTCPSLNPGDFYLIQFSDNQNLPIADQGEELEVIIDNVLSVNKEATQVILVGHSMGGLAARAYLQFRATTNTVLKLITVGTPHQGAELVVFMRESCQTQPINVLCQAVEFFKRLDPSSVAVTELQPDSEALELLNDLTKFPLPSQTEYVSIIGTGAQGIPFVGLGLEDGDGVVSARSQNLANVAGAPSLQHEAIVVPILENDACKNPLDLLSLDLPFDLVSIDLISGTPLQSHTCEPEDVGVWIKLLQQLRTSDPVTSGEGTPDLTAEIEKFKVKEQKSGKQKVVAKVSITNVGTETAVGPFSVSLSLSDDDILDDQDELLDTRVVIDDLAPGETAETIKLKKKGLEAVEAGSAIIVVDDDNQIAESNEENNILVRQIEVTAGTGPVDSGSVPTQGPINQWISLGLDEKRVHFLAIDSVSPTTVYAGVSDPTLLLSDADIGIFESTDGGNTWTETVLNTGVFSLAIDPVTPTTLYAGVTFRRTGVFKSTDGGNTWTDTGLSEANHFRALAIDPKTPSTIYAATREDFFKSTDGGATWTSLALFTGFSTTASLAIDPQTPTTVYVGTRGRVSKSIDGGATWTTGTGLPRFSDVFSLAIDPKTPSTVYAALDSGGVFKSTDGGATWRAINNGLPDIIVLPCCLPAELDLDLAIDPRVPTTIYLASGGVFKSTDGGANWTAINTGLTGFVFDLAIDPKTPSTVYAGTGEGVFRIDFEP